MFYQFFHIFNLLLLLGKLVQNNYLGDQQRWEENSLRRKNKAALILDIGRFDNIDSAVIIAFQFCAALLTLLMMTVESMLSKRPVSRISATLFFLLQLFHSLFTPSFL